MRCEREGEGESEVSFNGKRDVSLRRHALRVATPEISGKISFHLLISVLLVAAGPEQVDSPTFLSFVAVACVSTSKVEEKGAPREYAARHN